MPQINDWTPLPTSSRNAGGNQPVQINDWTPIPTSTPQPEKTWGDWGIGMGLRTVPSVAGSFLGPVGGAIGSGLGEILGQIYDDDEPFNWGLIGTETALGALPGFGKAGKGLWEAAKYGAKQGAIQGAMGSVPRHIAETGNWELPSAKEALIQTGLGGAFGGATGAGLHKIGDINIGRSYSPFKPVGDMSSYKQADLLEGIPPDTMGVQQDLPFPPRYRGAGDAEVKWLEGPYDEGMGGINVEGLTPNYRMDPEQLNLDLTRNTQFDPSGQGILFEPPAPISRPPVTDVRAMTPGGSLLDTPTPKLTPNITDQPLDPVTGEIKVAPGEDLMLIAGIENNQQLVETMAEEGYKYVGRVTTPQGEKSLFRQLLNDETGAIDPNDDISVRIVRNIYERLRARLGRDPSAAELDAAQRESTVGAEPTGRVAPFKGQPGSPEFEAMAAEYDNQITTRGGQESLEMMPGIEDEIARDREIADYLQNEDFTPPEMEGGPKRRWSEELKRFIDDESGSLDIDPIAQFVRERWRRWFGREIRDEADMENAMRIARRAFPNLDQMAADEAARTAQIRNGFIDTPPPVEQVRTESTLEADLPVQQQLMRTPEFLRPEVPREYKYPERTFYERAAELADKIVDLSAQAKHQEEVLGNVEAARATRKEIATLRRRSIYPTNNKVTKGEEFLARARSAKTPEEVQKYKEQAYRLFREEAGQMKLNFIKNQAGEGVPITPELIKNLENDFPSDQIMHGLSHEYASRVLGDLPEGPPGLEIKDVYPSFREGNKVYDITYRTPGGRPVAHARVLQDGEGGGTVPTLVADKTAGLMYGRGMKAVGKEILKLNAAKPSGGFSDHTNNLRKRLPDLLNDETGAIALSDIADAIGEGWNMFKKAAGIGSGLSKTKPKKNPNEYSVIKEALALPSSATTTLDLSAPGRQGLTQILTPQFWKALPAATKSISYDGWKQIDNDLRRKPIHRKSFNPTTMKWEPSYAEKVGLKLFTPASEPGPRSEAVASRWLETGGFLGGETWGGTTNPITGVTTGGITNPLAAAWKHSAGYGIRATNRFYISFLNHLKTNRAEYLLNRAQDMSMEAIKTGSARQGIMPWKTKFTRQEAMDLDPYRNLKLGREIAEFVNAATGQASATNGLERAVEAVGPVLFSPGLLNSRIRFLNPATYAMASPQVRREYIKGAFGAAMGWFAFTELAKVAADATGQDNEINNDVTNSDFGKFRIGNTRLDFGGGFLQFAVLLGRMMKGGYTSSSSGEYHQFGEGYQAETRMSNATRFAANKLNPVFKLAYDVMSASEATPVAMKDRALQLAVPLFVQDLMEMYKENPELLPWMAPVMFGAGTQTYGRTRDYLGEGESKFVNPEDDYIWQGGEIFPNEQTGGYQRY